MIINCKPGLYRTVYDADWIHVYKNRGLFLTRNSSILVLNTEYSKQNSRCIIVTALTEYGILRKTASVDSWLIELVCVAT